MSRKRRTTNRSHTPLPSGQIAGFSHEADAGPVRSSSYKILVIRKLETRATGKKFLGLHYVYWAATSRRIFAITPGDWCRPALCHLPMRSAITRTAADGSLPVAS